MAEITAALDEAGANKLLDIAIASLPTLTNGGSGSLGPFTVSYFVKANLTNGNVDLIPPDTIRIADLRLDWHIDFNLVIDLGAILPEFCLPQVCIAFAEATPPTLEKLKKGGKANFIIYEAPGVGIRLPITLNGFSKGLAELAKL